MPRRGFGLSRVNPIAEAHGFDRCGIPARESRPASHPRSARTGDDGRMSTDADLPFTRAEYADRLRRMRRAMADADVTVAILTAPDTMAWLTGYRVRWYRQHTSTSMPPAQCIVVHVDEGSPFIIDAGYHDELARASTVLDDVRPLPSSSETHEASLDDYVAFLAEQVRPWAGSRVGMERWSCIPSPAVADVVDTMLGDLGYRIVDVTLPFRGIRRRKSPAEIAKIEQAQSAAAAGIRASTPTQKRTPTARSNVMKRGVSSVGSRRSTA